MNNNYACVLSIYFLHPAQLWKCDLRNKQELKNTHTETRTRQLMVFNNKMTVAEPMHGQEGMS